MFRSIFVWQGTNKKGEYLQGELIAKNKRIARTLLKQQSITLHHLSSTYSIFSSRIKSDKITLFLRQLALLLEANIPLLSALTSLQKTCIHQHRLYFWLKNVSLAVASGADLSQALCQPPTCLSALDRQIIKAGEQAAALPQVLHDLAAYKEKMTALKERIHKALFYPCSTLIIALIISLGILLMIVPEFQQLFDSFGAKLPWLTRLVLTVAQSIKQYGIIYFFAIFLIFISLFIAKRNSQSVKKKLDWFYLHLPLAGKLYQSVIFARIARTLSILLKAEIPLIIALEINVKIADHYQYREALVKIKNDLIKGETFSDALKKHICFSFLFTEMVTVGEASGKLSLMLQRIAQWYDNEIDHTVSDLSQLLEPLLMIFLGFFIGLLVIAMYMPIFELGKVI